VLHANEDSSPKAILCHGKDSFQRTLLDLGEPLTAVEPAIDDETSAWPASKAVQSEEAEAATV